MGISRTINNTVKYIIEAMTRIFGPNDDAYPVIGVQPFGGDPCKRDKENW